MVMFARRLDIDVLIVYKARCGEETRAEEAIMPNHLAGESSPYLLQHADNPVDWYPWGKEALERAKAEDKPIFLSIGYSACHWCHVMERESFSDEATAELLNRHFISVKVDREERPDLDTIYMDAVVAMTGGGGWPLSVWLTPEGAPFYGGTYFPDRARYGVPSFRQVLTALAQAWDTRRDDLLEHATRLVDHLVTASEPVHRSSFSAAPSGEGSATDVATLHERALAGISATFDPVEGGWGPAPKFPQPALIEYLLTWHALVPTPALWAQVEKTLDAMAAGGIYDHLGGGFHRYSTDNEWLVPHFEKMLYDNAQLARCYLRAWQSCGTDRYRQVAEETLAYLLRDMRHPEGGFFSSEDADSEGVEGRFFVWTDGEIGAALPPGEAAALRRAYGITPEGNFEGSSILHLVAPPTDQAEASLLARAKNTLLQVRERRVRPGRDDKIVASWNGLVLAALADTARALTDPVYLRAAVECGTFLAEKLVEPDGSISHTWKDGRASGTGFLEDHALVAEGMLALYQATFDERWFVCARDLLEAVPRHFSRPGGGFYDTRSDHENLIARPRHTSDTPLPCGNSAAALGLLRLAAYTGDSRHWESWRKTIATMEGALDRAPGAYAHWLTAHLLGHRGLRELALVGGLHSTHMKALRTAASSAFYPDLVLAGRAPGKPTVIPLLQGREPAAPPGRVPRPAAWLCRQGACLAPITDAVDLNAALGADRST
jgi:uncharacterized protein YyaL (SSP411 family)